MQRMYSLCRNITKIFCFDHSSHFGEGLPQLAYIGGFLNL
jgi:hypothetical protein